MPIPGGANPNWLQQKMMQSLYSGGGVDPTFGMAVGPAEVAAEKLPVVSDFLGDPRGMIKTLLKHYGWESSGSYISRPERAALEAAGTPEAAAKLSKYERNMHKLLNWQGASLPFDDAVELLGPKEGGKFRSRMLRLRAELEESGAGYQSIEKSEAMSGKSTPVPTHLVSKLKSLLQDYDQALATAGIK